MTTTIQALETSADFISIKPYKTTADALSTISEVYTSHTTAPAPNDEQNLGLIIGLSVGIPCAVALIISLAVAIFCFYKKQKKLKIKERQCSDPGSLYETNISRAASNNYDDVDIPSRNEPVYDTVLQIYDSVYEVTIPKHK